jgi:hypothetical protein
MERYLVIENEKSRKGLVDTKTKKLILPFEYAAIIVNEEMGYVCGERWRENNCQTYEVAYKLLEDGKVVTKKFREFFEDLTKKN